LTADFTIKTLHLQAGVDVATLYVGEQIESSLAGGCDITSAFLRGERLQEKHSKVKNFTFSKRNLRGWRLFATAVLYKYIQENKFNLVIAHRFKSIHITMRVSKWLKIQMVGVVHGIGDYDREYRQRMIKRLITNRCKFVAVSEDVKSYMLSLHCGFSEENTKVIKNAIDLKQIDEQQLSRSLARQELGISQDAFVFGMVARLVPVKGHEYLLKALAAIFESYPQANVVMIGQGRLEKKLKSLVKELRIEEKVVFSGWKDDASKYVKAFDVYVMPSLSEGTPLAILEAMCGSVPVIGSKIPALESIIKGSGGTCFEPKIADDLALVMKMYLDMPKETLDFKAKSVNKYVHKHHDIETFQKSYRQFVLPVKLGD